MTKFKKQKKACFEAKVGHGKNSLVISFLFEEINTLKSKRQLQLKSEKTASSKKRKQEG
jgi:hypothetical protein